MSRLSFLLAAATLGLLVVPGASAFTITISGLDTQPSALAPGESHDQPFSVTMAAKEAQNIICATDATITVALTAVKTDESLGLGASVQPSSVEFTIPAGAHIGGAGTGWTASSEQSGTLTVDIGEGLPSGHTAHTYGVKADYDGAVPSNCQGDFPPSSDEADFVVPLEPPAEETPGTSPTNGGGESPTPTDEGDSEEGPAPGLLFALGAIGLASLLRRRPA